MANDEYIPPVIFNQFLLFFPAVPVRSNNYLINYNDRHAQESIGVVFTIPLLLIEIGPKIRI